jgi:LysR family transcriptional regulator for metE and metH
MSGLAVVGLAALPAWAVAPYLECGYIAARAYVADFIDTVKRDSFARLPGIRPLVAGTVQANAPA